MESKQIYKLIAEHDTKAMADGVRYYKGKSDIIERKRYYYDNRGMKTEDTTAENHRLVNNWHRLLVDQKVSYQFGKPMVFAVDENEEFAEKIDLLLGEAWDDTVAD